MNHGLLHPVVVAVVLIAVENLGILAGETKLPFSSIENETPAGLALLSVIADRSSDLSPCALYRIVVIFSKAKLRSRVSTIHPWAS